MKRIQSIMLGLLCAGPLALAGENAALPPLGWEISPNDTGLALVNKSNGRPVWRAVCDPQQPKPYVYPLATLDGSALTAQSPPDHPWHHSLWFAWKLINGVNYWEEDKKTGKSAGRTIIKSARCTPGEKFSARVELAIEYAPAGQPAVMSEKRVMEFSTPRNDGSYAIDWDATFTVGEAEVKLDRTPPHDDGKRKTGGYAGLSLRFPPGTKGWSFLTSRGAHSAEEGCAKQASWVDFSGPTRTGAVAGVAVFDHPANPRHPSAWYLNDGHPYFSPALIYHEPMTLKAGATMRLRYRVLVHNGAGEADALEREWKAFSKP